MSLLRPRLAAFVLIVTAAATTSTAQVPNTLLHSLFDPSTNAQVGTIQGYSVAVDDRMTVVGAPYDDVGGTDCGSARVYDATTGALLHRLPNPNPAANDWFGQSVAISGTRVVVGACLDLGFKVGSAYIFDLASAAPAVPVLTLINPNSTWGDYFGCAVAISGKRIAVGAYGDSTITNGAGTVYVYDLTSATPAFPVLTLTNPTAHPYHSFGKSVAISGARLVVGANGDAYVYNLAGATPDVPIVTLNNPSPGRDDRFGWSVAISGTRVVVGAYLVNFGHFDVGTAYVYDLASATPRVPVFTLTNPSPVANDFFGISVAISGARVLVGAPYDDAAGLDVGSAYAYDLSSATPTVPVLTIVNPDPAGYDSFGSSVGISGTLVIVGAWQDDTGAPDAGSAYTFDLAGPMPAVPVATMNDPSLTVNNQFGRSVAISGQRIVVGAWYDLTSTCTAKPVVSLANPGPASGDAFGYSVAMSGTRVVVGAPHDHVTGTDAGSAYVYDLTSPTPNVPVVKLTDPRPNWQDRFGEAVAVSGTRVVVGAPADDTRASDSGIACVYDLVGATPGVPILVLTNPALAEPALFGLSVAIAGSWVVVGSRTGNPGAGSAYVYDLASRTPNDPVVTLTNPSPARLDLFGDTVAVSGTRVVVGAGGDDAGATDSGSAYVYDMAGANPTVPILTLTNPWPVSYDYFGISVAISDSRVVVGSWRYYASSFHTGGAYVFDLASATPTVPVATLNNPSPTTADYFGDSVAIDGTTILVGAPLDDTGATDRGAAYVFGLRPTLQIAPATPGHASISWTPTTSSGFVLQYSDGLAPAKWVNTPSGATNPVTIPLTNAERFYRLIQP